MRVNDAVFCCGCNFRAFGGNSPGTLIDCGLQHVSSQSRCGLVLSKDPVAAPLAPVRCDKSAAQAVTHWAAGAYLDFARRLIIGGKNAACANKHSRNYRRRCGRCSGWRRSGRQLTGRTSRGVVEAALGLGSTTIDTQQSEAIFGELMDFCRTGENGKILVMQALEDLMKRK